ncbi:tyrosine-type recombinase/integrase [Arthrobacter agilis]|nr:site-specific integrase [Arthrobacter agilis]
MKKNKTATLRELLEKHIELRTAVGGYTLTRYGKSLNTKFGGQVGAALVKDIDFEWVARWVNDLTINERLAPKTIRNYFGFLSSAFKTAIRLGWRRDNPCYGVRLPGPNSIEAPVKVISTEEWGRIMLQMDPHYRLFFQFLRVTGMRLGEATALRGTDFEYGGETVLVNVSKAWKRDGQGGRVIGPPKTASSRRKVALNTSLAKMLVPLVKEAGGGLVFTNMIGTPIQSSAIHKHWGPACIAAGFTEENKPRIHDIRHTSSSMFLHGSADMHSLSRRLGHKDIKMTVNVYGHLMPEEHRKMAEIADEIFE